VIEAKRAAQPDTTLAEHAAHLAQTTGVSVNPSNICRMFAKRGITRKKSLKASERDETARAAFREQQPDLAGKRLRVLDETSTHLALTRRYGYAPSTERVNDSVPRNSGKNMTLLTTMTFSGMDVDSAVLIEGSLNGAFFDRWVVSSLAPKLQEGEIVLMDNLSVHLSQAAQAAIKKRGATVIFLPAYSPDLSPIELAFAKIKEYLRSVKARTKELLMKAIEKALDAITAVEAKAWFAHCGYPIPAQ